MEDPTLKVCCVKTKPLWNTDCNHAAFFRNCKNVKTSDFMFGSPLCGSTQTNKMGTKKYDLAAKDQLLFSANISFLVLSVVTERGGMYAVVTAWSTWLTYFPSTSCIVSPRHKCCLCTFVHVAKIIHLSWRMDMWLCFNWTNSQGKFSTSEVTSEYCGFVPNTYHLFALVLLLGPKSSWSGCTVESNHTADNTTIAHSLISECPSLIKSHFSAQALYWDTSALMSSSQFFQCTLVSLASLKPQLTADSEHTLLPQKTLCSPLQRNYSTSKWDHYVSCWSFVKTVLVSSLSQVGLRWSLEELDVCQRNPSLYFYAPYASEVTVAWSSKKQCCPPHLYLSELQALRQNSPLPQHVGAAQCAPCPERCFPMDATHRHAGMTPYATFPTDHFLSEASDPLMLSAVATLW